MIYLAFLFVPTLIALGFLIFGGKKVTLKEFLVQLLVQVVIVFILVAAIMYSNTADTEVLNGAITRKHREKVGCRHSYQCNCYTTCSGGKNNSCSTHCSTCYEHFYDVDWDVNTSLGNEFNIATIDRQGLKEPPRWTQVIIGEPYAETHHFENYVKAAPDTLFRQQGLVEKYKDKLPGYPQDIQDYYRLNRLVTVGLSLPDAPAWNATLSNMNRDLGAKKQVNMIAVVTQNMPEDYFYALQQHWVGGKKNDAILVVDVDQDKNIQWAQVMAWTDEKIYMVRLRDAIMDMKVLDTDKTLKTFADITNESYKRKSMKDFAYLKSSITPSVTEWIVGLLISISASIGLGIFFYEEDVFNEE